MHVGQAQEKAPGKASQWTIDNGSKISSTIKTENLLKQKICFNGSTIKTENLLKNIIRQYKQSQYSHIITSENQESISAYTEICND